MIHTCTNKLSTHILDLFRIITSIHKKTTSNTKYNLQEDANTRTFVCFKQALHTWNSKGITNRLILVQCTQETIWQFKKYNWNKTLFKINGPKLSPETKCLLIKMPKDIWPTRCINLEATKLFCKKGKQKWDETILHPHPKKKKIIIIIIIIIIIKTQLSYFYIFK